MLVSVIDMLNLIIHILMSVVDLSVNYQGFCWLIFEGQVFQGWCILISIDDIMSMSVFDILVSGINISILLIDLFGHWCVSLNCWYVCVDCQCHNVDYYRYVRWYSYWYVSVDYSWVNFNSRFIYLDLSDVISYSRQKWHSRRNIKNKIVTTTLIDSA